MTVLIIGYPKSGKSELAEKMVTEISAPGERVYVATMIPYDDEGLERIERHKELRKDKGFDTVEAPFDVVEAAGNAGARGRTVLLECLSNLVANELFERHTDSGAVVKRAAEDMESLKKLARDLIIVSNHFEINEDFDEETMLYAKTLDAVNDRVSAIADKVIRIT